MIVEPFANDKLEDNLNPIGRIFYAASTMLCTPASLSQEVGWALGRRLGRPDFPRFFARPGLRGCAAPPRRLSISFWKRGPDISRGDGGRACGRSVCPMAGKNFLQHAVGRGVQLCLEFPGLAPRLIHQRSVQDQPYAIDERT